MKKLCCLPGLLFFLGAHLFAQDALVFRGIVKCYISDDERSTRGAKNVVVIPGFIPKKSGMTGDQGYYEINTSVPFKLLEDKYILLYYISACKDCEKKVSVFVSSEQIRTNKEQTLMYISVPTLKMNAGCKKTELDPAESDKVFNKSIEQPGQDIDKVSSLNVLTAAPGLLNAVARLATIPLIVNDGTFFADTTSRLSGKISGYGKFLFASPMTLTGNTGFNFSPLRDRSESVFWNPSTLVNSPSPSGMSLVTNLKNNFKFSAYTRINDKLTIGIGGIYTSQDEFRPTSYNSTTIGLVPHLETLKEYAVFLSPSYKITKKASLGLAVKSIWQSFNIPVSLFLDSGPPTVNVFTDKTIKNQYFDADISFSYLLVPSLKAGINIMNIFGTKLYGDAFATKQKNIPIEKLRSLGLGLCYRLKQFNFGTDVLLTEDDLYDVSVGCNYVPFNNALLSAGFAFKQKSFSAGFKWKQFKVSYVDDNGLMVNEKRPGRAKIFNGHIYSGFVFGFR
jgi:hypothetical protein